MALIRFFTVRSEIQDLKDLKDVNFTVTDANQLSEFIRLLRQVSTKDALEPEEVFKAVEIITQRDEAVARIEAQRRRSKAKDDLRRIVAKSLIGALGTSFLFVLLHSSEAIQLPGATLKVINESVIAEVIGLFGVLVSYLFGRSKES